MKTTHFTSKLLRLACAALTATGLTLLSAFAQTMPQDNWRYDGLQFASPVPGATLRSIAVGSGGVYVAENIGGGTFANVIQFTEGGVFVRRFTTSFGNVVGIACDPAGNVYVLDGSNATISAFSSVGAFVRQWGSVGSGDGELSLTYLSGNAMIAVDKNSQVYVCDPGNGRIQVFSATGSFLRKWGQNGGLLSQFDTSYPQGIVAAKDGRIIVSRAYSAVTVFDGNGVYKSSFYSGNNNGAMAISPDDLLFPGGYFSYVQAFDTNNNPVSYLDLGYPDNVYAMAISKRGDLFAVKQRSIIGDYVVSVFEREYSNVQNSLLPPAIPQPSVLAAAQRSGTNWLDIDYQVTDADSATATTGALAFKNGGNTLTDAVQMTTFTEGTGANLGANQPTGLTRHLTWNMAADWSVDFSQVQVEVLAKDSRNLLGVHWITVPAEGANPAFSMSSAPVSDAAMLSLWYWFIGTHQAGTSLGNGVVSGTSGIYTGQTLAYNTASTTAGRAFAYGLMSVRPPTSTEIFRAKGGSYGFSSVDSNSVIMQAQTATSYLKVWVPNWQTPSAINVTAASAGSGHLLFVTSDGTLWGVGANNSGQLGIGTTTDYTIPVQIASGVSQVAAGNAHSLFLKTDGTLWAMGYNGSGQLGDGTTTDRTTPVQVASGVAQVAAGQSHSLYVKTDGTLWAMGYNDYGQLGNGATSAVSAPVQVATGVSRAYSGSAASHSFFIKTNNSLWAMGQNVYGQLGDGTNSGQNTPVQIASSVATVAVGNSHSLYVTTGGTLFAMGGNGSGQLGDGTTTNRNTPGQIAIGVSKVAAGRDFSLFTKTNKTLWAVGRNSNGQLNDGTTTDRSVPIQVDVGVGSVFAGDYYGAAIITGP